MKHAELSPSTAVAAEILPFSHPQGCKGYLVADSASLEALAVDPHLDLAGAMARVVEQRGFKLRYVVETHTHADHPSGALALAASFKAVRAVHVAAGHHDVGLVLKGGEVLRLGGLAVAVRHAPGHTPDHIVLHGAGALFSGDTLLIGAVARADFLGGDAGTLHDTLRGLLHDLPGTTLLYPGHDYAGRVSSTLAAEQSGNPWLQIADRDEFKRQLAAHPPPRPANMDELLRFNRQGELPPPLLSGGELAALVGQNGAANILDVRTGAEWETEHIQGSRWIPLDELEKRADEARIVPAPRLLLCRTGNRAQMARASLEKLGLGALRVIEGGLESYKASGGLVVRGRQTISLERQVRIVAGGLVLAGALLGLVHAFFLAIPIFVGAGLVFAGITDFCGMGLLLARMPWNRATGAQASCSTGGGCAAATPGSAPEISGGCAASPPDR